MTSMGGSLTWAKILTVSLTSFGMFSLGVLNSSAEGLPTPYEYHLSPVQTRELFSNTDITCTVRSSDGFSYEFPLSFQSEYLFEPTETWYSLYTAFFPRSELQGHSMNSADVRFYSDWEYGFSDYVNYMFLPTFIGSPVVTEYIGNVKSGSHPAWTLIAGHTLEEVTPSYHVWDAETGWSRYWRYAKRLNFTFSSVNSTIQLHGNFLQFTLAGMPHFSYSVDGVEYLAYVFAVGTPTIAFYNSMAEDATMKIADALGGGGYVTERGQAIIDSMVEGNSVLNDKYTYIEAEEGAFIEVLNDVMIDVTSDIVIPTLSEAGSYVQEFLESEFPYPFEWINLLPSVLLVLPLVFSILYIILRR